MDVVTTARKWGNSIGITLTQKLVQEQKIKPNDTLVIVVKKISPISDLFGTIKFKKSAQEIKNELRRGWD